MMRIISGKARGTKLKTLEGSNTRPTLERVKEALFSMIQFDISDAYVLDLFSGSGQLALEAVSRGARFADMCDSSKEAVAVIRENIKKTHFEEKTAVYLCDYKQFLLRTKQKYDLVFLDPPYKGEMIVSSLKAMFDSGLLSDNAVVVCELAFDDNEGAQAVRDTCCGKLSLCKDNVYSKSRIMIFESEKEIL